MLGKAQGNNEWLDINDARVRFYSNGHIAWADGSDPPGYFVPASSNTSPLFSAGIWIGGVDEQGQLKVAAHMYGVDQDFHPGPLSTGGAATISPAVSQAYDQLWKVNATDVLMHQQYQQCVQDPNCDPSIQFPGYTIPDAFSTWPAHGDVSENQALYLAPFFDLGADNVYDPTNGDHPCVPGDQALYMIFNDNTAPHMQSLGLPIGLEVHMMPFAYTNDDPSLEQTIFIHYRLVNRSSHTLNNVFLGTFADADLGCYNDDFIGSDVGRNMMFFYNSTDVDAACSGSEGYGSTPPAFGIVTLKGPMVDANGSDDPQELSLPSYNGTAFNDGVADNERHGLSRMISFAQGTGMSDPSVASQFYSSLQGIMNNGAPITYGGTGYESDTSLASIPTFFMFPWDTDTLGVGTGGTPMPPWQETQPTPNSPDRRGLASMGPFTLEAGEEDDILIAYVFARAESGGALASVDVLKARVDSVHAFAETIPGIMSPGSPCDQIGVGIEHPGSIADRIQLYPNPAKDMITLAFGERMDAVIQIHDVRGRSILHTRSKDERVPIDISSLPAGLYHVQAITASGILNGRFVKEGSAGTR